MHFCESLFSKTFLILGTQFLLTYLSAKGGLNYVRQKYNEGAPWVFASKNEDGEQDLDLDWEFVKGYFYTLLVVDVIVFLLLLFVGTNNLAIGIPIFIFWSVLTGIGIALALISVDESLGARILALTALVTVSCALIGMYSGINFSILEHILFSALGLLILFGIIRLFINLKRATERIIAFFGVVIFAGYLLFDFNHLQRLGKASFNSWQVAMSLSIDIYLDVINLFLHLLDLFSKR